MAFGVVTLFVLAYNREQVQFACVNIEIKLTECTYTYSNLLYLCARIRKATNDACQINNRDNWVASFTT